MSRRDWCKEFFGTLQLRFVAAVVLMTIASPSFAIPRGGPPETPGSINAPSTDADGTYTVSWAGSMGANWYELQEKIGTGGWATVYSSNLTSVTFSKAVVASYSYHVAACSYSNGCSSYSYSISVNVTGGITAPAQEEQDAGDLDVGTAPYSIDVAGNGDSIINVPLRLIPGVAGFAPSLSLAYDSGRGVDRLERSLPEDTVGYGWRLVGLSEIRRCVVNKSSGSSIQLSNSDSLCLDGMPLVLQSGSNFSVGAIYRTLIESYIKVEVKGATGALWFEATLPDGTVREYGNGGGSRVDNNGGVDYKWSLSRETSTDGNVIDYSYWFDPSKGINRIALIDYSDATVDFEYMDRTDASGVSIGSATQTQTAFLHTIRVKYNGTNVREYRLLNELVSSRLRLAKIQLCGYDEAGTTAKCLIPLHFDWLTPSSTMAGVPILVDGMTDGLGAVQQIEYGTITGSSHPFLFPERPFNNGSPPSNTQLLSGSGALRHVVTKLQRDNGLGGFHDTSYAYQNKGLESTKHWGFLGFYAQRITDEESGVVSYVQYRLDYPFFGRVARLQQLDAEYPSQTQTLTATENDYATKSISHGSSSSVFPYRNSSVQFMYEGTTQLGGSAITNAVTVSSGLITEVVSTAKTGTSVSAGTSGGIWGDIGTPGNVSSLLNTTKTTITFENRTSSGQWLIGFADSNTKESWPGSEGAPGGIVQDVTLTPQSTSLKPATVTQFPTDDFLTLQTNFSYDNFGRMYAVSMTGDNVLSRTSSVTGSPQFVEDRYPHQLTNAKGHTSTNSQYDARFGTVKQKGDPNGRNTTSLRDPFGRVTSITNADGVVTTHTYSDCSSGCNFTVYGIAPTYRVVTTTKRSSTTVAPPQYAYYDKLGRVIRKQVQAISGSRYVRRYFKYDSQGRVRQFSLPTYGSAQTVVVDYDDPHNRLKTVSRPD